MRALLLCPEAPYPLRGGGAMRTAAMLGYLARKYRVSAILFRERGAPDPRTAIPAGLLADSLVIDLPVHSRSVIARVWRNAARAIRGVPPLNDRFSGFDRQIADFASGHSWDLCLFEHFWTAGYADLIRPHARRLVLDLHNVESQLYERWSRGSRWPVSAIHARFAAAAARLEHELLPRFDLVLAPSEVPGARVYPNTIPARDPGNADKRPRLVFSANFDYPPNLEGLVWFARHVWPDLQARYPNLEWLLAGRHAPPVNRIARVAVTGEVDDMLPWIAESSVAIVPILSGSGTRIKILEAWRAGTPVVSTTLGAEGLPVENRKHLLLADTPADFARAVGEILDDPALAARLTAEGRRIFSEYFTWEAGWKILDSLGV